VRFGLIFSDVQKNSTLNYRYNLFHGIFTKN
jgi:hypothetical protein